MLVVWFLALAAVIGLGGWLFFTLRNRGEAPSRPRVDREADSSPFEQILAELQGIRLRVESGEGRANVPKIARLVRIFLDKTGVPGARTVGYEELRRAVQAGKFSPHQAQEINRILERCESVGEEDFGAAVLEFDPLELIQDFRRLVYQVEGREYV